MEWIPVVFVVFKVIVLGVGMFFAIKWHYDKGNKGRQTDRRALLRAGGQVALIFALALLAVGLVTLALVRLLGM